MVEASHGPTDAEKHLQPAVDPRLSSAILRCSPEKQPMGVTRFARYNSHPRPRPSIFDTTTPDINSYTSEFRASKLAPDP